MLAWLIKACDYHINALPTPPVYGFSPPPPPHRHPAPRYLGTAERELWSRSPPSQRGSVFCYVKSPNPQEGTALHRVRDFPTPASCRARGPDASRTSRRETRPPAPTQVTRGNPKPLSRIVSTIASAERSQPPANAFLSLTFSSQGKFCPRSL